MVELPLQKDRRKELEREGRQDTEELSDHSSFGELVMAGIACALGDVHIM